ncbi:MAG: hypothetical protein AAFX87_01705 [Bacteroidota bacterium]
MSNTKLSEVSQDAIDGNVKFLQDVNSPWALIKKGRKYGASGFRRFVPIFLLFFFVNFMLLGYAIIRIFTSGFEAAEAVTALIVLAIGVGFVIWASRSALQYAMLETLKVIYENSTEFFKRIFSLILDQAEESLRNKASMEKDKIEPIINVSKIVNEKFQRLPKFLRKMIIYLLNKVPFADFISEFKQDLIDGNKEAIHEKLFQRVDTFLRDYVFALSSNQWIWWRLPLNIVVQILTIYLELGLLFVG